METRLTTRRLLLCGAAIAAFAALASGCGSAAGGNAFKPPQSTVRYANSQLKFLHPTAWKAYPFRWQGELHFQPMLYLSTQPVHDPCATYGGTTTCTWPVGRLAPGGVLVVWENRGFPGWTLNDASGKTTLVGGRQAKRVVVSGECRTIGGTVAIEVAIASPEPSNWTQMTACLRGPDLAQNERALDAMLASTHFLAP